MTIGNMWVTKVVSNHQKLIFCGLGMCRYLYLRILLVFLKNYIKDTHREKAPSSKTPALTKSTKIGIWVVVTPNQVFIRGS